MLAVALVASGGGAANGAPVRLQIRGSTRIEAHGQRTARGLTVTGRVVDDAGVPAAGLEVDVTVARSRAPQGPLNLEGTPEHCAPDAPVPRLDGGMGGAVARPLVASGNGVLRVTTDPQGAFCLRVPLPVDEYVVHLHTRGTNLMEGSALDVKIDLALRPVSIDMNPRPQTLLVDDGQVTLSAVLRVEDEAGTQPAANVVVALANEEGPITTATTSATGRVEWRVDSARLGAPGPGEIRVSYAGGDGAGAASLAFPVERHQRVDLFAGDLKGDRTGPMTPEEGAAVQIVAKPRLSREGARPPSGSVVALVGETVVGASPLAGGEATVVATFLRPAGGGDATVRYRYAPDAPWNEASADLTVLMPMKAPSPWQSVPVFLAGAGILAWLALGRVRRVQRLHTDAKTHRPEGPIRATVEVVREARSDGEWSGVVVDAHDDQPVGGARVVLERAAFDGVTVLASTSSAADGTFRLSPPAAPLQESDVFVAEAPYHAALRKRVPPRGELRVALVLRKRAVLDAFVAWAKRRGRPFDARPEPTPAHVRRVAGNDFATARWADALERAAFGPEPMDGAAEGALDALKPAAVAGGVGQRSGGASRRPPADGPPPPEDSRHSFHDTDVEAARPALAEESAPGPGAPAATTVKGLAFPPTKRER